MTESETWSRIWTGVAVTLTAGIALWVGTQVASIEGMKKDISQHETKLDDHEDRLRFLERR